MGAWGAGSFENDDAGDWVYELADADDTSILMDAFSRVTDAEDDVEAPDASIAIAAAEVVAALRKRPAPSLPDEAVAFVTRIGAPASATLIRAASKALARVKSRSELKDLWDESDEGDAWHRVVADLMARLG